VTDVTFTERLVEGAGQAAPPNGIRSLLLIFPAVIVRRAQRGLVMTKPPGKPALVPLQRGITIVEVPKLLKGV
jgi:hypothetical protein